MTKKVLKKVRFTHPYFDQKALNFQSQFIQIYKIKKIFFIVEVILVTVFMKME